MKRLILLLVVFLFSACSVKITYTKFNVEADESGKATLDITSDGFDFATTTDQAADAKVDANFTGM